MSNYTDLYESNEHRNNMAHFASLVHLAVVDGAMNPEEDELIQRFKRKLSVTDEEYKTVMKNPKLFPIAPPLSSERRLERMYDLFRIVYADHQIDESELLVLTRYARGLGYSEADAHTLIEHSIKIFGGQIPFEDYKLLIDKA